MQLNSNLSASGGSHGPGLHWYLSINATADSYLSVPGFSATNLLNVALQAWAYNSGDTMTPVCSVSASNSSSANQSINSNLDSFIGTGNILVSISGGSNLHASSYNSGCFGKLVDGAYLTNTVTVTYNYGTPEPSNIISVFAFLGLLAGWNRLNSGLKN
jgi:hypothetical protein